MYSLKNIGIRCINLHKNTVVLVVSLCGLVEIYLRFGGTCCIYLTGNRVRIVDNNTLQLKWR